ncbi:MAG TPA: twin-arginine translocation signal domain-containing protein, partial [Pirellulales bacterium]|nr:twin-arginine translocation signal domain-containing protein [Pirellulales bacterium]
MVEKNTRVERVDRRQVIKGATAAVAAAAVGPAQGLTAAAARPSNAVSRENERPGTTDWQLTYTRVDPQTGYRSPS